MAERRPKQPDRRGLFSLKPRTVGSFAQIQPQKAKVSTAPLTKLSDKVKARRDDGWIADAYTYADEIGEVGFVVNLTANLGARCLWVPHEYDDTTQEWSDTENVDVLKAMAAFRGPQGGQTELKRRANLHLSIAGISTLLASPTDEPDVPTGVLWEFLSSEEIRVGMGDKAKRYRDSTGSAEDINADETYLAIMMRSHPRWSGQSDSPIRRVLSVANEILYLTRSVAASVRSRLAAGVLLVPEEADFTTSSQEDEELEEASADVGDEEVPEMSSVDRLAMVIAKHLRAPVEDPMAPGSLAPLVIQMKSDMIQYMQLLDLSRSLDPNTGEQRKEALERLARGLDVDPGILQGKAQSTHWNGWLIDDDLVEKHVIPAGELIVEFVTVAYLRPVLSVYFGMTDEQARRFKIVLDPSPIKSRSDEAVSARVLFEEGVLRVESLLRANGFDPSDMPDDDEAALLLARRMLIRNPAVLGPVLATFCGLPETLDWSKVGTMPAGSGEGGVPGGSPVDVNGQPSDSISPTSGTTGMDRPAGASVDSESFTTLMTRVATASDGAIDRAFEVAGSRLFTRAKKDSALRVRITGVDKGQVLTAVAPSDLAELGVTHELLFDGAWKSLNQRVRCWVKDFAQARGQAPLIADELGAAAASNLCNALTAFVVDHRHSPIGRQRNGLAIPDELVLEALHSAGVV